MKINLDALRADVDILPPSSVVRPDATYTPAGEALIARLSSAVHARFGTAPVRRADIKAMAPEIDVMIIQLGAAADDLVTDLLESPETRQMFIEEGD